MAQLDRRTFLAGAAVVAFDPADSRWLSSLPENSTAIQLPHLDGELVTDEDALTEAATDYGHLKNHRPRAVLRPGSVDDVVTLVRFANEHGLVVAVRGQGHSTFGQAQADCGVVIDSRTLAAIHEITPDRAVVDAGVQWLDLVRATLAVGVAPPVSTDYLGLSVGGTLCVGGIGGASQQFGMLVDNTVELQVVTGEGHLVTCSAEQEPELFEAVLGGLGQFAVIVRATVRLETAPAMARVYTLTYPRITDLTAAQRTALADGRFDYLEGQLVPTDDDGFAFVLEGGAWYTTEPPDDAALLAGIEPPGVDLVDVPYFEWLNRLYETVEQIEALRLPGPWLNAFLPDAATDEIVTELLTTLTPADAGGALLYPARRSLITRPQVRVPDGEVFFLLALLRAVSPPDDAEAERLIADNDALYARVLAAGGTQYPVNALRLTPADWRTHYGDRWPTVLHAKDRYDPRGVLTPGQGIFEPLSRASRTP
ncbi:FAD-binding protein [Promicromonospora sp. MEB111]|uniref:FAD-binding protein n=1 Tax=Promicromonospora sp. MEB111 TaxID=3040301 RepID=UPI00254A6A54|nr:FAD-binding protein [Promicromonospora sp. MEB111]